MPPNVARHRRTLIFLSSHRRHVKVADRLTGALAAHWKVELICFDRDSANHPVYSDPNISYRSLGPMRGGVSLSRLLALARAAQVLWRAARRIDEVDSVLLVNTTELLLLARLCGLTRRPTVLDVTDIHPLQIAGSAAGRALRWLERKALKRVNLLVVSSPWFYWDYFIRWLNVTNPALLIENKTSIACKQQPSRRTPSNRIAWNGLLRCQVSAAVLLECLTLSPDSLQLSLHGGLERLEAYGPKLLIQPNCTYTGPYEPQALPSLLATASFDWAVDYADRENSEWLLPNRLYEAIAMGIPLIAVAGTATGAIVGRADIGIVLAECTAQAVQSALENCRVEIYQRWLRNMDALRPRVHRGDEWSRVFAEPGRWGQLKQLPREVDLSVVLRAESF